ncbi:MAG: hypothetical protein IH899_21035, partial [Planctomycetes bacterium]|nr:hypothetical protein [Planctomycetota bacterium]
MRRQEMRLASPNEGHLLAAALLRENAVNCVLTLNFDLAMTAALEHVGAREDVAVINGPSDHEDVGQANLIYINGNAHAKPTEWVLTTDALDDGWRETWTEVVVARFVSGPVTVFAGLGSPSGVLLEITRRLRSILNNDASFFQVDPGEPGSSPFSEALNLPENAYVQMGWTKFMTCLSQRVIVEQMSRAEQACRALAQANSWDKQD